MSTQKSLWGALPLDTKIRTPATILREQAAVLTDATGGLLQGAVTVTAGSSRIVTLLDLIAPALDGYTHRILSAFHQVVLYPVTVDDDVSDDRYECEDQGTFEACIERILSSAAVHRVVGALLAQSRSE